MTNQTVDPVPTVALYAQGLKGANYSSVVGCSTEFTSLVRLEQTMIRRGVAVVKSLEERRAPQHTAQRCP